MDKKYDHLLGEQRAQDLWQQEGVYNAERYTGPLYSIDTPPPTVSGALHIGHIFSYTQTDIIARYKRMNGFKVFYPFGFDDNGLATERFVEKKRGVSAFKLGRTAFIKVCLEETHQVEQEFKALWQRMGLSVDWRASYSTIDDRTRALSQKSFIELYNKGYVYRKQEPALFCVVCRTSVAQAELDDAEKPSVFYTLAFKQADGSDALIATTRPELLPSVNAVFFHPDDARYNHLKGKKLKVPVFGFEVTCLPDELVIPEKGTGLVMCSTFGDKTDIAWYLKHNLEYKQAFGTDGIYKEHTGPLAGLTIKEARKRIVDLLQEAGDIRGQREIMHSVNIHERCKTEIEYMLLPQWFLRIMPFKETFLELADQIAWYPAYMKSRYINWVQNISWDWGLSRQRYFGIPFPAWHCVKCDKIVLAQENQLPIDPQETPYPGNCVCGGALIPDTDVMDTWNTSSLTPYLAKSMYTGPEKFMPMSMRPQAHDIIRTWAFYTIIKSWMHDGIIPWESIVISGHVLSPANEKISKSQGNSPMVPENLLKMYPADVIRYWTASASLGTDTAFADTQLKLGGRTSTKLWNAFLFIKEHGRFEGMKDLQPTHPLNRWVLHEASKSFDRYVRGFTENEFSVALESVERYFWSVLCDQYLELVKDQFFNPGSYDAALVEETKSTLALVGMRILQMFAPFMPHMTEIMYQELYRSVLKLPSLHMTQFSDIQKDHRDESIDDTITVLLNVVNQVRKLKTTQQLSLKTDITQLTIGPSNKVESHLKPLEQIMKGVTRAQSIVYGSPAVSELILIEEGKYAAAVNTDQEQAA